MVQRADDLLESGRPTIDYTTVFHPATMRLCYARETGELYHLGGGKCIRVDLWRIAEVVAQHFDSEGIRPGSRGHIIRRLLALDAGVLAMTCGHFGLCQSVSESLLVVRCHVERWAELASLGRCALGVETDVCFYAAAWSELRRLIWGLSGRVERPSPDDEASLLRLAAHALDRWSDTSTRCLRERLREALEKRGLLTGEVEAVISAAGDHALDVAALHAASLPVPTLLYRLRERG